MQEKVGEEMRILKKNKRMIIGITIAVVLAVIISVGSCYVLAENLIDSKDVYYEDNSSLGFNNVQDAIDGTCTRFSDELSNLKNELLKEMYPVGSIYISTSLSTVDQVKKALGGEWEAYGKGQTLVGVDTSQNEFNEVEKDGGSKSFNNSHTHTINPHTHTTGDHILTIAEMPSHNHQLGFWIFNGVDNSGGYFHYGIRAEKTGISVLSNSYNSDINVEIPWGIVNTGGGQAHNHGDTGATALTTNESGNKNQTLLQPYITVYMYKRVS